jgi:hypothetical protein
MNIHLPAILMFTRGTNNHPTRQGAAPCAFAHASPVMAVTCGKSDRGLGAIDPLTFLIHWFSLDQKK